MPDPTTFTDTDDLIEAMRKAGWYCTLEVQPDPVRRGDSRYYVGFLREPLRPESGRWAGAPTLRKAVWLAATRAAAALRATDLA